MDENKKKSLEELILNENLEEAGTRPRIKPKPITTSGKDKPAVATNVEKKGKYPENPDPDRWTDEEWHDYIDRKRAQKTMKAGSPDTSFQHNKHIGGGRKGGSPKGKGVFTNSGKRVNNSEKDLEEGLFNFLKKSTPEDVANIIQSERQKLVNKVQQNIDKLKNSGKLEYDVKVVPGRGKYAGQVCAEFDFPKCTVAVLDPRDKEGHPTSDGYLLQFWNGPDHSKPLPGGDVDRSIARLLSIMLEKRKLYRLFETKNQFDRNQKQRLMELAGLCETDYEDDSWIDISDSDYEFIDLLGDIINRAEDRGEIEPAREGEQKCYEIALEGSGLYVCCKSGKTIDSPVTDVQVATWNPENNINDGDPVEVTKEEFFKSDLDDFMVSEIDCY